jgi:hypothetical protein
MTVSPRVVGGIQRSRISAEPFRPMISAAKADRHSSPEVRLLALEEMLRTTGLPLADAVPILAPLLTLSTPETRYPPRAMSPIDSASERSRRWWRCCSSWPRASPCS